jgi:hypothetical protein
VVTGVGIVAGLVIKNSKLKVNQTTTPINKIHTRNYKQKQSVKFLKLEMGFLRQRNENRVVAFMKKKCF